MKDCFDSIIIGAGPAGITAAIYLKRANLNCLIIEKGTPGGQMSKSSSIANYPGFSEISGPDLAMNFYNQLKNMKIPYKYGEVTEIIDKKKYKIVKLGKEKLKTKSIILAVGRQPKSLTKESSMFEGRGVSFCSLCDGALYKGEDVSIVGGGNSALEESLYLSDLCKHVIILNRSDELHGDPILIDKVNKRKNIKVLLNAKIDKFYEENGKLSALDISVDKKPTNIKVKACFIFIGYEPATDFLQNLDILDEKGYIMVNERLETKIKNIFAAGDVVKKEAFQIVTATSDGAVAAVSCIKKLS